MNPAISMALVVCLVAAAPAAAGVIRGTVRLPAATDAKSTLQPYAGNANALPGASAAAPGRVQDAVVYVASLPAPVAASLPERGGRPQLVQEHQAFTPRVLAVAVGTEVDFPNRDAIYHNVFSLSPVQRFDLGKYPRGQSKQVTFRRAGRVQIFCDIHSNMEAHVVVLPHRAFAQPGEKGAYVLPALPPGTYDVVLWHPDFGEVHREVTLGAEGDARLDLSY